MTRWNRFSDAEVRRLHVLTHAAVVEALAEGWKVNERDVKLRDELLGENQRRMKTLLVLPNDGRKRDEATGALLDDPARP